MDEREIAALRAAYRRLQSGRSESCPQGEALATLVTGEAQGEDRLRLADHVTGCRACSADYATLLEVHALASPRLRGRRSPRAAWIAAALFALAIAGTVLVVRSARRDEAFRAAAPPAAASVEPKDGATLTAAPDALQWPARKDAEGYHVKLFTSAGDPVWEADAGKTDRIAIPDAVRAGLAPRRSYFWTVDAQLPFEKQRLGPYSFTLAP
jgi:hypothetical protein